jgi:NAD(P)-dependent dehydrogenase (short-subunit alcohol dehydrogenase family)
VALVEHVHRVLGALPRDRIVGVLECLDQLVTDSEELATNLRETSREILGSGAPDMNKGVGTAAPERLRAIVPLGKRGTPEDVANVAVFLASAESDYVNGHTLVVDGGWIAH